MAQPNIRKPLSVYSTTFGHRLLYYPLSSSLSLAMLLSLHLHAAMPSSHRYKDPTAQQLLLLLLVTTSQFHIFTVSSLTLFQAHRAY